MKYTITLVALGTLMAGLYAALPMERANAQDVPASGDVEPLITAYELMETLVGPLTEDLKAAVAAEPADRKGWQAIYKTALAVGEVSTLGLTRNDQEYMSTPEWRDMTLASRALTVEIAEASKAKDFATAKAKYVALIESCNVCHVKFEPDTAPKLEP